MSEDAQQREVLRAHVRWNLTRGVGATRFARIREHFGDAVQALGATASELHAVPGISTKQADAIARARDVASIDEELDRASALGVTIVPQGAATFPPGLREMPDPPILLYVGGTLRAEDVIAVAVVGSRRPTVYGGEQARRFAELLGEGGITVVSGLARGVDAFAHHGALGVGGRTLAVLGSGMAEIYPPENAALAARIRENGALLSELPLTTPVRAGNFPARNRIIAGLSLGTLVIEAAQRSGALITARLANEYNREVFAVPGPVDGPLSQGPNGLIRDQAAKLVTGLPDILAELGDLGRLLLAPAGTQNTAAAEAPAAPPDLPPDLARVLAAIPATPIAQERLVERLGLALGELLACLTTLELRGLIHRRPGPAFVRAVRGG